MNDAGYEIHTNWRPIGAVALNSDYERIADAPVAVERKYTTATQRSRQLFLGARLRAGRDNAVRTVELLQSKLLQADNR